MVVFTICGAPKERHRILLNWLRWAQAIVVTGGTSEYPKIGKRLRPMTFQLFISKRSVIWNQMTSPNFQQLVDCWCIYTRIYIACEKLKEF